MKTLLLSLAMIFMAHADNSTDARPKTKKQKESITKIKDIKHKRELAGFSVK